MEEEGIGCENVNGGDSGSGSSAHEECATEAAAGSMGTGAIACVSCIEVEGAVLAMIERLLDDEYLEENEREAAAEGASEVGTAEAAATRGGGGGREEEEEGPVEGSITLETA